MRTFDSPGAKVAGILLGVVAVQASCPNACSNHGVCSDYDACECSAGFHGADCSLQTCPVGRALADVPRGDLDHDGTRQVGSKGFKATQWSSVYEHEVWPALRDEATFAAASNDTADGLAALPEEGHFYAECSNAGNCDRHSGECRCYEGFTGSACQRRLCPNNCQGRGICRSVAEILYDRKSAHTEASVDGYSRKAGTTLAGTGVLANGAGTYRLWDRELHHACICDTGFTGHDCSQRTCPLGDDPVRPCPGGCRDEIQTFQIGVGTDSEFMLTLWLLDGRVIYAFPVIGTDGIFGRDGPRNAERVRTAILQAAGGSVIPEIHVSGEGMAGADQTFRITFVATPGNQEQMAIRRLIGDGYVLSPMSTVQDGNREAIECSGKGNCDRDLGECECFPGYTGGTCEQQVATMTAEEAADSHSRQYDETRRREERKKKDLRRERRLEEYRRHAKFNDMRTKLLNTRRR